MQPALGLGFMASHTPKPAAVRAVNVSTHAFFGIGLWLGVTALMLIRRRRCERAASAGALAGLSVRAATVPRGRTGRANGGRCSQIRSKRATSRTKTIAPPTSTVTVTVGAVPDFPYGSAINREYDVSLLASGRRP